MMRKSRVLKNLLPITNIIRTQHKQSMEDISITLSKLMRSFSYSNLGRVRTVRILAATYMRGAEATVQNTIAAATSSGTAS